MLLLTIILAFHIVILKFTICALISITCQIFPCLAFVPQLKTTTTTTNKVKQNKTPGHRPQWIISSPITWSPGWQLLVLPVSLVPMTNNPWIGCWYLILLKIFKYDLCFSRALPLPGTTVEEATEPPAIPDVVLFPLRSSLLLFFFFF